MSATPKYILPGPALARAPSEAIRAVEALEQGDWPTARDLAEQLGRPGLAVRQLALSMRERALGVVTESWQALAAAAACCPPERRPSVRTSGPGDQVALRWPFQVENEFWCRLGLVGRREELQARNQWVQIEDSIYPKRTCLIEGFADHLTWVFFDRFTWRAPRAGEWLPINDRVTRGKLGEADREYFLRRANERVEQRTGAGSAFRHVESFGRRGDAMPVAVSRRRTPGHAQRVQVVFPSGSTAPGLMHDCTLGAGVRVRVNAANPGQWHVIWVDAWNDHARPLLKALIGPGAVQQLDSRSDSQRGSEPDLDWIGFDLPGQYPDGSVMRSERMGSWSGAVSGGSPMVLP